MDFNFSNIQQLSALISNTELLSAIMSLSGMPIHPYEQAKCKYFDKDYKFPDIKDIPVPDDFCPYTYMHKLTCMGEQTINDCLSALSTVNLTAQSLFEDATILDPKTVKHNIEFTELVKTISIDDIKAKPMELIQKLTSFYVKG